MKTQRSKRQTRKDSAKEFFKQMFYLSSRLESFRDEHSSFENEINTTIDAIDELMEIILPSERD